MAKTLHFEHRGEWYKVDEQGRINANGIGHHSPTWIFLGGPKHHTSNRVTVPLTMAFDNPGALVGCLGWDRDHGTTRTWGGAYCGKLPRITQAYVITA
jgi:hypothetical protein